MFRENNYLYPHNEQIPITNQPQNKLTDIFLDNPSELWNKKPTIRDIASLKPHPEHARIYGDEESIDDIIDSLNIGKNPIRITITPNDTIISGHRLLRALKILGIKQVEVTIIDSQDSLIKMICSNVQRIKTNMQIGLEYAELVKYYLPHSKARMSSKQRVQKFEDPNLGKKTRDIAAEKLKINPTTADQALFVVNEIQRLQQNGDTYAATELKNRLNKSIYGTYISIKNNKSVKNIKKENTDIIETALLSKPTLEKIRQDITEKGKQIVQVGIDLKQESIMDTAYKLSKITYDLSIQISHLLHPINAERGLHANS